METPTSLLKTQYQMIAQYYLLKMNLYACMIGHVLEVFDKLYATFINNNGWNNISIEIDGDYRFQTNYVLFKALDLKFRFWFKGNIFHISSPTHLNVDNDHIHSSKIIFFWVPIIHISTLEGLRCSMYKL